MGRPIAAAEGTVSAAETFSRRELAAAIGLIASIAAAAGTTSRANPTPIPNPNPNPSPNPIQEFSAFYGRRVYLCKRLENVVPA